MLAHDLLPILFLISLAAAKRLAAPQSSLPSFRDCIEQTNVPVLFANAPTFSTVTAPFNLRTKFTPVAVTIPDNAAQVKAVIDCARTSRLHATARSGGHSYNAQGLGGEDGHIIIDLKHMHAVSYDNASTHATVGAGARLGNIATAIYEQGGRAIPHGNCYEIGVGGHSLLGGYGSASRMWGLMLDNVLQLEVVTADGEILTANDQQNADLFWALKGAGPSFGIVTKFVFKTYAATEANVIYSYKWANVTTVDRAEIFSTISDWSRDIPKELSVSLSIFSWEHKSIVFSGVYYGKSRADFYDIVQPVLTNLSKPVSSEVNVRSWIDTMKQFAGGNGSLNPAIENYNGHDTFFAKSLVTQEDQQISTTDLENFYNYADDMGVSLHEQYPWFIIANLYGGKDSAINNGGLLNRSSYAHRSGHWVFQFYSSLSKSTTLNAATNQTLIGFLDNFHKSIGSRSRDLAYVNYVDPTLSREEAHRLYYGEQLRRLEQVKSKYDARNVFYFPQSIIARGGVQKLGLY